MQKIIITTLLDGLIPLVCKSNDELHELFVSLRMQKWVLLLGIYTVNIFNFFGELLSESKIRNKWRQSIYIWSMLSNLWSESIIQNLTNRAKYRCSNCIWTFYWNRNLELEKKYHSIELSLNQLQILNIVNIMVFYFMIFLWFSVNWHLLMGKRLSEGESHSYFVSKVLISI